MARYKNTPPIVTNGLVLQLDAGSRQSYVSGSTTWNDLSGNLNSGSLTNSPTFNSTNQGAIAFNGTTQYIQTPNQVVNITTNWTTNVWFNTTGSTNIGSLVVRGNLAETLQWRCELQASTGKVNFVMRNSTDQSILGITSTNDNMWHMATYTNSSNVVTIYLDGKLENSATITNLNNIAYKVVIGRLGDSTGPYYYSGSIAQVSVYNRALNAQEVAQNYNALKSRFGLT